MALQQAIAESGLTQAEVAEKLGTKQPRISRLMNGHVDEFNAESLERYLGLFDISVEPQFVPTARTAVAIVVDLTFATDQPGVELGPITKHTLDSGPVIARGTTLHPRVFELLHEAGEAEGIPFTVESLGRGSGTDADAIHLSRAGVPTGLVSVPSRYMHSPVEMVSLADIDAAARLIAAFARRLEPGTSFER